MLTQPSPSEPMPAAESDAADSTAEAIPPTEPAEPTDVAGTGSFGLFDGQPADRPFADLHADPADPEAPYDPEPYDDEYDADDYTEADYDDGDDDYDQDYADEADEDFDDEHEPEGATGAGGMSVLLTEMRSAPPRKRRGRWVFVALVLVLLAGGGVVWLSDARMPQHHHKVAAPQPPEFIIPLLAIPPDSSVPSAGAAPPPVGPARTAWIDALSARTDLPRIALAAYLQAADLLARSTPACHLSWTTLAGVGWVESRHGLYHGDTLLADGEEAVPIIGPALDGTNGNQRITDTDHGALDGDPVWDHALGPMQFLPHTWSIWGRRAAGDGRPADPQNINDAALTAGRYLCASGGDLGQPTDWWQALFVYNNSITYGQTVYSGASAYAQASEVKVN